MLLFQNDIYSRDINNVFLKCHVKQPVSNILTYFNKALVVNEMN